MKTKFNLKDAVAKLNVYVYRLHDERGQDLIEYALLVALVAFAATAGMKTLATDINAAFLKIGTTLTTYTA
jgi:pilus assembly protein Flp/PilA